MKYLLPLFFFSTLCSYAQLKQSSIIIGKEHHLHSKILQEERIIWVYLPPDYQDEKYAPRDYPVIYLLDGDANFHSMTGIQQFLSKGPYASVPQMIVVGILNTDRSRDLTPSHYEVAGLQGRKFHDTSGGGENFTAFLEKELIPYIDSSYRTTQYRILIGHSFGGLTAINILLNHTELFSAYMAIDPSMWWDHEKLLSTVPETLASKNLAHKMLYLTHANKAIIPQDTTTDHQRAILKLSKLLPQYPGNNLDWKFQYFENEDHGTVPLPSEFYGLKFFFRDFQLQVKQVADKPELVTQAYANLSARLGFEWLPTESYIDWLGNYCLSIDKPQNALTFFKINQENYPKSPQVYQSLGKAYLQIGEEEKASRFFQKIDSIRISN